MDFLEYEFSVMLVASYCDFRLNLQKMPLNEWHLFEHWPEPGVDDDKKKSFFGPVCLRLYPGIIWVQ